MLPRAGRRAVRFHHLDQRWWPQHGIRKRDVLDYYDAVAPVMLPHLRGRPLSIKRHYNGPRSPFEWIKDAPPELPDWVPRAPLPAKSRGGALVNYALVADKPALLWLVDFGSIDFHVWTSRADRPNRPDFVLFDLDPAGVGFAEVVRAALLLRQALDGLGLAACVKTTGGAGLHVQVPIARRYTHEQARNFSAAVAVALRRAAPRLVTTERTPAKRRGVFVDTKMNGHGQQVVCAYSLRPGPEPAVATPIDWDELEETTDPYAFTPAKVCRRVERFGDLAAPLLTARQRLPL